MEEQKEMPGALDLVTQPGFCVKENRIIKVNAPGEGLFLAAGMDVMPILLTGRDEYAAFRGGCLYLSLDICGQARGAAVTRTAEGDIFLLDPDSEQGELRSLALAAQELRKPLSNVMTTADGLRALAQDAQAAEQLARLNRGLYQLLRIVGNMSDAGYSTVSRQETRNVTALLEELFQKAAQQAGHAGITMGYSGLKETVYCLTDAEQLERAVWNILSNAITFTPKGGTIDASLTRQGRMLRLSVRDSGSGIAAGVLGNVFKRFLRQPAIEDSRFGLGLGMVFIRSAAAAHGGAVLIDQPEGAGTRVTMTLAIRQNTEAVLHSPVLKVDYTGERDHGLVELSNCLPAELYQNE